eukprot:2010059-Ditylum_brightwellii.AAC.1
MLAHFLVLGITPIVEDVQCNIIYQIVKHDWHNVLYKWGRIPADMSLEDLVNYFEQIKFLEGVKQKSETIIVDDNCDK